MTEPVTLELVAATADVSLADFAAAVVRQQRAASSTVRGVLAALCARAGFPARLLALLERSALTTAMEPSLRFVVEAAGQHLGEIGFEPGFELLVGLHRRHPQREVRIYVGHGLFGFGRRGLDALAGPPGADPGDLDPIVNMIRLKAALHRGDDHAALTGGDVGRRLALLAALDNTISTRDPVSGEIDPAAVARVSEPQWLEWIVAASLDPPTAVAAERVLNRVPRETWQPLKKRLQAEARTAKAALPATTAKRKPSAKGASGAAIAALDESLVEIRSELDLIVGELRAANFVFVGEPLGTPADDHAARLEALERQIGPVPVALARFWAIVGSVDLRGNHPAWARPTWLRTDADEPVWHADPIVICSLETAVEEADDGDYDVTDAVLPYELAVAGDAVAKANYSGGRTSLRCGNRAINVTIEPHRIPLLDYLRSAVLWGGFPGFATIRARPPGYPRPSKVFQTRAPRRPQR